MPLPVDQTGQGFDPFNAECPSRQVLDLIADKWSVLVLSAVVDGYRRNGALLRRVQGISQKALTRTLRALERNGLISRHDHRSVPPHVDYDATPLGASIRPLLGELCAWAIAHMDEVHQARAHFTSQN